MLSPWCSRRPLLLRFSSDAVADWNPKLVVNGVFEGCPGWCWQCDFFDSKWQVDEMVYPIGNDSDKESQCGHHVRCPGCNVTFNDQELRDLYRVVASGSEEDLRRFVARHSFVRLNVERAAIQVEGCRPDQIVVHLPLSERQVAAAALALHGVIGAPEF